MAPLTLLDIVKRTPKTNCGDCNHPTCLAFAAAVTTRGEALNRCPYLDTNGLDALQPVTGAASAEERDLALVRHLKDKIADLDFAALAPRLGLTLTAPDSLEFRYLGQQVVLHKNGLLLDGGEAEDPRDQILIYNYLAMGAENLPEPAADDPQATGWIGMESLPNSISKTKTLAAYSERPLAELLQRITTHTGDVTALQELFAKVDGAESGPKTADYSAVLPILPRLAVQLLFWREEPEDGFDAKVKILFAPTVLTFLDIESLVFCCERLADRLVALWSSGRQGTT